MELPHSPLAEAECLEQLRALQAGITKNDRDGSSIGIDTPADLKRRGHSMHERKRRKAA